MTNEINEAADDVITKIDSMSDDEFFKALFSCDSTLSYAIDYESIKEKENNKSQI